MADKTKATRKGGAFKHLSIKVRRNVYLQARATAVMADVEFRIWIERAIEEYLRNPASGAFDVPKLEGP